MKAFITTVALVLSLSSTSALAERLDPCTGPENVLNSWFVSVNDEDLSSREDILQVLRLIATGGFSNQVFDWGQDPSVTIFISFDPSYWADAKAGRAAKAKVLRGLKKLDGVLLRCNPKAYPAPAIGVRN
jgi:hypothetical protein